jgi:hypothetical protein
MGPGSRERRIATIKAFCRWSWKWRPQRAHWTIDYRASIGLYWYFNSNVSATHTHNYICTTTQSHNHTFEYIYILVVFYIHYIIIQYIIICLKALKLYIYICAQSILCACLKLFVCMSCSTLYNIIISCFVDHIIHSLVHYHSILASGFRTWHTDEASVAKSGSCKEPDFPCDRLGSKDETAGWQAKTRVDSFI